MSPSQLSPSHFLSVVPTFSSSGAHPEFLPENEHPRTFLLALILKLSFTNYFVFPSPTLQPHPINPTELTMSTSYALCPNSFWSKSHKKLFFLVFLLNNADLSVICVFQVLFPSLLSENILPPAFLFHSPYSVLFCLDCNPCHSCSPLLLF